MCPWVSSPAIPHPSQMTWLRAQIIGEDALQGQAIQSWVTGLHVAEQALLGREQSAPAVDLDRAPFHHDAEQSPPLLCAGRPARKPQPRANFRRQAVIVMEVVVFRPSVEFPVDQGNTVGLISV